MSGCSKNSSGTMQAASKKPPVFFGPAEIVILTANVKCAVEWYAHTSKLTKFRVMFEIFALLQKVREYDVYYELLLRDKAGPLMQVLFYKMEQPMPKLSAGQVVRIVGQPLARTRLQAFCVRLADTSELQRRDLYLSNQSLIAMKRREEQETK